jgi:hypothetical protein
LRLCSEEREDGIVYGSIFERVKSKGKYGDEDRDDLIEGEGRGVLDYHTGDSTGSIISRIVDGRSSVLWRCEQGLEEGEESLVV